MAVNMNEIVVLEATLYDYSPRTVVANPFKPSGKRWLPSVLLTKAAATRPVVGRVQMLVRKSATAASGSSDARCHAHVTHWLRFEDVTIRNDRDLPLYVLLSRASDAILDDDRSVRQLEAGALPVLLDRGPEGQWKGAHFPRMFEQELLTFDPLAFASIAIGKPAAARPPTALMLVFAHGAFQTFVPPTKSSEQLALEMDALSTRLLQSVMEMEQDQLQGEDELSLDALQRNAHQLFRMFDQDKSDSIDFEAKRFFQLVDEQKK
ncbi:hypothetical protein BBJ28_00006807 [Nothophytophthora sp. Chile5]|nr:hypothetical protein BBJ28_00006807 [Nothophytophthora sp. Chile5]